MPILIVILRSHDVQGVTLTVRNKVQGTPRSLILLIHTYIFRWTSAVNVA